MKSENRHFPKNKLKYICFSTLKWCSFDKVEKNLSEAESIVLKNKSKINYLGHDQF